MAQNLTAAQTMIRQPDRILAQVSVSILIVTYNSCAVLPACLDSLAAQTRLSYEIILVDNASQDDTVLLVRTRYPSVTLIENKRNVGFAAAVNQAGRVAQGVYYLLLNPDTVVHAGAVDILVAFMQTTPEIGVCAPRSLRSDGVLRPNCFLFGNPWNFFWGSMTIGPLRSFARFFIPQPPWRLITDTIQVVEAVSGAALLIGPSLYWQLGGLDERFFMYFEDFDLCYRVQHTGHRNLYIPQAVITHHGGHSVAAGIVRLNGMIGRYALAAQYHYIRKHFGVLAMWTLRLLYGLAGLAIWGLSRFVPNLVERTKGQNYGRLLALTPVPPHSTPFRKSQ